MGEHCCKYFDASNTPAIELLPGVYAVSVRIRRLDLIGKISMAPRMEPNFIALPVYQITNHQTHDCRWYDQISSKLTILLNIQKVMLTTKLASPSVMGKPTVVATDSLIFHLIHLIHQADAWNKSEYLHMGIWLQVVITLYKGHNNWHIDCSHAAHNMNMACSAFCFSGLCLHHHRKTYMTIFILYKWNT